MDNFKNFGEALAWMMESPENVAVWTGAEHTKYRWSDGLQTCHCGEWGPRAFQIDRRISGTWSRAPREPLEFRGVGISSASGWLMHVELDGEVVNDIRCNAMSLAPSGTRFELILKEKN